MSNKKKVLFKFKQALFEVQTRLSWNSNKALFEFKQGSLGIQIRLFSSPKKT